MTTMISTVVEPRERDLGGIAVRRVLPSVGARMVGPFVFLDVMGPTAFPQGRGIDVAPHPHIGLATVTYLFEGEIVHRDSLGSLQAIRPGDINWMTAGRGIVHSERSSDAVRAAGARLHGIQLWVALPTEHEQTAPEFHHHPAASLPERAEPGVRLRVLLGSAFGSASPVRTHSPLFYADAQMDAGGELAVPATLGERAAFLVEGAVRCGEQRFEAGRLLVLAPGADVALRAEERSRLVLLGGRALEGPRYLWWNFVSSSLERLAQARTDWTEGRFPVVPDDAAERMEAPEALGHPVDASAHRPGGA